MGNLVEIAILLYPTAHLSSVGGLTDLFKFINNHENNMKLYKFILVLNLLVGAYSITNDDANA